MEKLNFLKDSSSGNDKSCQDNKKNNNNSNKSEKVLCNHCGRTKSNGIRCLGICVADNDY